MNKITERMVNVILLKDKKIHRHIAQNAVHYALGCMTAASRNTFTLNGNDKIPVNYFGITLAASASGKDVSADACVEMTKKYRDKYDELIHEAFAEYNRKLGPSDPKLSVPMYEFSKGTPEGFMAARYHIQLAGFGIVNVKIAELQDLISQDTDFFSEVVQAWEKGETSGKLTKAASTLPTKGIPVNVLAYGSPDAIVTNKGNTTKMHTMLTAGLGRRLFITFINAEEHRELKEAKINSPVLTEVERMDKEKFIRKEIAIIDTTLLGMLKTDEKTLELTPAAHSLFDKYSRECDKHSLDIGLHAGQIAELSGRAWKMIRLAALYAAFGSSNSIDTEHIEDAIEYTEECSMYVDRLFYQPSMQEALLDYLHESSSSVTRQAIMKEALGVTAVRDFDDAISLAEELADERNQVIEVSDEKIPKYSLTQLSEIDLKKITISTSNAMGVGWKPLTGEFNDLASFLKTGRWYSAGTFTDGIRDNAHYIPGQDLLIFDIDEDMTMAQAQSFFADFKCIIATTRNHQKEKHPGTGDIWDRFRIILVPDSRIDLVGDVYNQFMLNAMDMIGIPADRTTIDPARFYFGNKSAEVWVSEGTKLFNVAACIPSTSKAALVHKRLEKYDTVEGIERYFIASTDKGDRNNKLWRYACVLKDDGYSDDEIEAMVVELNGKIADPLPERELRVTVLRSIKRK